MIADVKRRNYTADATAMLYFLGEVLGCLLYCCEADGFYGSIGGLAGSFWSFRMGCTFLQTAINSFSGAFLLILCCFLAGLGTVFQPIILGVPFFRGLGIGITLAEMYALHGFSGIAAGIILVVPYAVFSSLIIFAAVKEALIISVCMFKKAFLKSGIYNIDFVLYVTKFMVLSGLLAVASVADSLITFLFAGLWTG